MSEGRLEAEWSIVVDVMFPHARLVRSRADKESFPATPLRLHVDALGAARRPVLSDRSGLTDGTDFGVQGENIRRLADLGAKHAFLRAGSVGGRMPCRLVADDLAAGRSCGSRS